MKSVDQVGIVFANLVLGGGIYNGVVNVTLGAYAFDPNEDTQKIEPSPVVTARLRLDVGAARALRDQLTRVLDAAESQVIAEALDQERAKASVDAKAEHLN